MFLNIAYGSNLHPVRLGRRCPSAELVGTAPLEGWTLGFHKRSADGSGKCDAVPTGRTEDRLWVAVYRIAAAEKAALDAAEGLGHGYDARPVEVRVAGATCSGSMYVARAGAVDPALRPYDWYHALVVGGARHHGFPAEYVGRLEAQPTIRDPHPERAARNWAIVAEMGVRHPRPSPAMPVGNRVDD